MHSQSRKKLVDALSTTDNLFSQLILAEMASFRTKALETATTTTTTTAVTSDNTYYINNSTSAAVIPVSPEMQSFKDILNNRQAFMWNKYDYLFKNVTRKILTLEKQYSFKDALVEIDKFRTKAGPHFYGAILRRGEKLINPFHCLTPFSYAKHPDQFSGEFTVLLFFYSNRAGCETDLGKVSNQEKLNTYLDTLINNIIKCSNHKIEASNPNNIEAFFTLNVDRHISSYLQPSGANRIALPYLQVLAAKEVSEKEFSEINFLNAQALDSGKYEYLLVPHQIMVNGIFAPDYGASLLRKGNSSLHGTFLTPSVSCNIQSDSLNTSVTWASVCTGRESQRTFQGISSLHCANYASAYNSNSHSNGSISLADISIKKSVEIYQKLGILPTVLPTTPTPEELEKLSDFMGYIDYMTTTYNLSLIDIETRYNTIKGQTDGKKEQNQDLPTTSDATVDSSNGAN